MTPAVQCPAGDRITLLYIVSGKEREDICRRKESSEEVKEGEARKAYTCRKD